MELRHFYSLLLKNINFAYLFHNKQESFFYSILLNGFQPLCSTFLNDCSPGLRIATFTHHCSPITHF